ncbi:MAG: hypothetical protein O7C65_07655, partial [Planctomycetota bacterium]|nr:hypothetical protein [Planctomycetota bacterium]MCZ6735647.1 hypothetical protein [Planctomycetota bacterium]
RCCGVRLAAPGSPLPIAGGPPQASEAIPTARNMSSVQKIAQRLRIAALALQLEWEAGFAEPRQSTTVAAGVDSVNDLLKTMPVHVDAVTG